MTRCVTLFISDVGMFVFVVFLMTVACYKNQLKTLEYMILFENIHIIIGPVYTYWGLSWIGKILK